MKIKRLFKLILLVSGLFLSFTGQAAITDKLVQEALKALYTSTGGANWNNHTGWTADPVTDILCPDPAAVPEIVTYGIVCDGSDNVVELALYSNNLVGPIPAEIGNLSNLVRLKLYDNQLTGQIPSELSLLSKLVELRLFKNRLDGAIPGAISNLNNLLYLELYDNKLSGQLPVGLGNLTRLWNFFIKGNQFKGELPSDLVNMGSLYADNLYLDLKWNAVFSSDATLNSFINANHTELYEASQTLAPSVLTWTGKSRTSIDLVWSTFNTNPSTTGGYKILQSTTENGTYSEIQTIADRATNTFTVNNLVPGVNYWFKICSYTDQHVDNSNIVISVDSDPISKQVPTVTATNQVVDEHAAVSITATGDSSVTGYSWSQISGIAVTLSGGTTAVASFTAPEVASSEVLVFRVTGTDDFGDAGYYDVQVTVNNVLVAPTVSAGLDQTVDEGVTVNLSASANDSNGTIVEYLWEQIGGSPVSINGDTTANASIIPYTDIASEILTFRVTVTDNDGGTASDVVSVSVNNVLIPPTVYAGVDQAVDEATTGVLIALASDSNGTIVDYLWKQLEGPVVTINGSTTANASFTAPTIDVPTEYLLFSVTVTDNDGGIASDTILVTVNNVVIPPVVDAGMDQIVDEGTAVALSATASDDGTVVSYFWQQISGTAVTIADTSLASISVTAPMIHTASEVLEFKVTVTDDESASSSDTVRVTVNNIYIAPTVDAGLDQTTNEGTSVVFSASANDDNGTVASYLWQQISGTAASITGHTSASVSVSAPAINTSTEILEFKVTVTDNDGDTASDTVRLTVSNVLVAPDVSAGVDIAVNEGNSVSLVASASDANGTITGYLWEQVSGIAVSIINQNTANASFVAPIIDVASAILEFKITVTDNDGGTDTDTVLVTVNNLLIPPTVNAGVDQSVNEGTTVTLSATAADTNGTVLAYHWSQLPGTAVILSATNTASVSFEAPKVATAGEVLVFEVRVTDNDGGTATDQVQVTVNDVKIEPEANPSSDRPGDEVEEENWIELNANAFDVDGEVVTYHWEQLLGPTVVLESTDTPTTRFIAPTITNHSVRLLFKVTVTDDDELIGSGLIYVIVTKRNVIVVGNGALSWFWLLLLAAPLLGRRYLK